MIYYKSIITSMDIDNLDPFLAGKIRHEAIVLAESFDRGREETICIHARELSNSISDLTNSKSICGKNLVFKGLYYPLSIELRDGDGYPKDKNKPLLRIVEYINVKCIMFDIDKNKDIVFSIIILYGGYNHHV